MTEINYGLSNLVSDRIKYLDGPRKSWLLKTSAVLKPEGFTVIPFPDFQSGQGRSLIQFGSDNETLTYTRSDILNILMAFAGNEAEGDLKDGALTAEVKEYPPLMDKIRALKTKLDKLNEIPDPESNFLFQNALTLIKLEVGSDLVASSNILSNQTNKLISEPIAEGFKVAIPQAMTFLEKIFDQLLSESVLDQHTGHIINGENAGLIGCFYDQDDAKYLSKMLEEYIK